jgi:hypothetical protein
MTEQSERYPLWCVDRGYHREQGRYAGPDDANLDGVAREIQAAYTAGLAAGREHERLDVIDFLQHPPGRIPDHWKTCVAELVVAVNAGRHVGGAMRLYDKSEREPGQEGGAQL